MNESVIHRWLDVSLIKDINVYYQTDKIYDVCVRCSREFERNNLDYLPDISHESASVIPSSPRYIKIGKLFINKHVCI